MSVLLLYTSRAKTGEFGGKIEFVRERLGWYFIEYSFGMLPCRVGRATPLPLKSFMKSPEYEWGISRATVGQYGGNHS